MQPCEYEDSVDCFWDAQTKGNGEGMSFTVDAEGNVTYVHPPTAPTPEAEVPAIPVEAGTTWQVQVATPEPTVWEQSVEPITETAPELPPVVDYEEVVAMPVTRHDATLSTGIAETSDMWVVATVFITVVAIGVTMLKGFKKKGL